MVSSKNNRTDKHPILTREECDAIRNRVLRNMGFANDNTGRIIKLTITETIRTLKDYGKIRK